jgi:hypothetical protein
MLTQPRIALGVMLLRAQAPIEQSKRTTLADYAPTAGAVAGVLIGRLIKAPPTIATLVTGLGIARSILGTILLRVAWRREWVSRDRDPGLVRGLALHLTSVPATLAAAAYLG